MKIYSCIPTPVFAAEGRSKERGTIIFLFTTYEQALNKGKELVHQAYQKVSVYRVG